MRRLVFGALLLASCSTGGIRPLEPNEIATAPYRPVATKAVLGSLMYERGCLLFESDDHSTILLPIWPTGTTFEESLVTAHEPGKADQRVVVGEEIELHGVDGTWSALDPAAFAPFQKQCSSEPFFVAHVTAAN